MLRTEECGQSHAVASVEQIDGVVQLAVDRARVHDESDPLTREEIDAFVEQDFEPDLHHREAPVTRRGPSRNSR